MPHNIENLVDIKNSSSSSNSSADSYNEAEIINAHHMQHQKYENDSDQHYLTNNQEMDKKEYTHNYINQEEIDEDRLYKNNLVITKGSKKWLGDTEIECEDNFHENIYVYEHPASNEENSNIILDVVEGNSESMELDRISVMAASQMEDRHNLTNEHDNINLFSTNRVPSRASMLVEAALDSVDISADKNTSNLIADNSQNILHNIDMADSDHIDIDEYGMNLGK